MISLTSRQVEVLELVAAGLSDHQVGRRLGISSRTVEHHLARLRERTGTGNRTELTACALAAGLVSPVAGPVLSEADFVSLARDRPRCADSDASSPASPAKNSRVGYVRACVVEDQDVSVATLRGADCSEIIIDTSDSQECRPRVHLALGVLRKGDTLVVYRIRHIASSVPELLALLRCQLYAKRINLHILSGACAGLHRPDGATPAERMLFLVAEMSTELDPC
jgi:DNA-binding CsgD family transcriptional regulator